MKKSLLAAVMTLLIFSCGLRSGSDKNYTDPNQVYKLRLNPASGSQYYYTISNQSDVKMNVNDKKINNVNQSSIGISYAITKDSSGNFILKMLYYITYHATSDFNRSNVRSR